MHTVDLRTTDSHMDLVTASCGSVGGEGRTAGRVPLPSWGVSAAGKGLLENSGGTWPTIMPRIMSVVIYGVCVALASSFLPLMRARPPRQSAIAHLLGAVVWGGGKGAGAGGWATFRYSYWWRCCWRCRSSSSHGTGTPRVICPCNSRSGAAADVDNSLTVSVNAT